MDAKRPLDGKLLSSALPSPTPPKQFQKTNWKMCNGQKYAAAVAGELEPEPKADPETETEAKAQTATAAAAAVKIWKQAFRLIRRRRRTLPLQKNLKEEASGGATADVASRAAEMLPKKKIKLGKEGDSNVFAAQSDKAVHKTFPKNMCRKQSKSISYTKKLNIAIKNVVI